MSIFEMFGGEHNKQIIEKVYLNNNRDMEITLDLFLTGSVPKETEDELHVIIEQKPSDIQSTQNKSV